MELKRIMTLALGCSILGGGGRHSQMSRWLVPTARRSRP